ncbi:dTDP-4-amino-4,6-dideoxygalactose transaminase [Yoonia sp. SDW83-1]|uniref:dTDP-4-amino-4,6-dideoxygalactose transaminase n=1 Tax=Yoonia sp. SDW83-1 TaxID=3366945 RepID=UPI00398C7629
MAPVPFNRPTLIGNEIAYIREAIQRGQLAGDGYFTARCQTLIEDMTGAKKALLTHSCTAALEMSAILCDLGPGDEVIMPSYTFVSTANAVVLRGAVPVFVDIERDTLNIDPAEVAAAVTPRTKAIFAVHYAGYPADMDALAEVAEAHDLLLVEDAAQALGSTYKGRKAGSLGDMAAFSFHETKNIISGEGGALTIMRPDLIERAEIIREKGTDRSKFFRGQVDKYSWVDMGSSFLPGELISSYMCAQLETADVINTRRLAVCNHYRDVFTDLEQQGRVQLPRHANLVTGNGHMFYLIMRDLADRTAFIAHMKAAEIITPFHYVPLHSAPAGKTYGRAHGDMTVTNDISDTLVRLPMYFDLGANIEHVLSAALDYFEENP